MFLSSTLTHLTIHATDGEIGKVRDLYFNDHWELRFIIVDTRKWLPGKKVLLPFHVQEEINLEEGYVKVARDKETIRESPKVPEEDNDFIATYQEAVLDYFGWNSYKENAVLDSDHGPVKTGGEISGNTYVPPEPDLDAPERKKENLRSIDEFMTFRVHARDGKIGSVDNVILNKQGEIKYLVINSHASYVETNLYLYHTDQVTSVDWFEKDLYMDDTLEALKQVTPLKSNEEVFRHLQA